MRKPYKHAKKQKRYSRFHETLTATIVKLVGNLGTMKNE